MTVAISERGIGITEGLKRIDAAQRAAKINYLLGTPSGKNIIPDLVGKAKQTGSTTIIKPGSEHLDNLPRIYGNHLLVGGELIVTAGGVIKMPIPNIPKAGK